MRWLIVLLWLIGTIGPSAVNVSLLIDEELRMDQPTLGCVMNLLPVGDGEIGISFEIRNTTSAPVTIRSVQPFVSFDLAASAIDGDIPVIQPRYDPPAMPNAVTVPPGEQTRIDTPITLAFAPLAAPSGGDVPTRWLLRHDPIPVRLLATLHLDGVAVEPCENRWDPEG